MQEILFLFNGYDVQSHSISLPKLCILFIKDCCIDESLFEGLMSGEKTIDFDKNTCQYSISYYNSKGNPKSSTWIKVAKNAFLYKFQSSIIEKNIEYCLKTYFEDLHRFYSISSSVAQHAGQSKMDIVVQAHACATCIVAFFDFLNAYKLLSGDSLAFIMTLKKFENNDELIIIEYEKKLEEEKALRKKSESEKRQTETKLADAINNNKLEKEQTQRLLDSVVFEKKSIETKAKKARSEADSVASKLEDTLNELISLKESYASALAEIEALRSELKKQEEFPEILKIEEETTLDNLFDMPDNEEDDSFVASDNSEDILGNFELSDIQRKFVSSLLPLVEENLSIKEMSDRLKIKASTVIERLTFMIDKSIIQLDYILKRSDIQDILYALRQTGLEASLKSIKELCFYKHSSEDVKFVIAVCKKQNTVLSPVVPATNTDWKFVTGLKLRGMCKSFFSRKLKIGMNENGYYLKDEDDFIKIADAQPGFSLNSGNIVVQAPETYYSYGYIIKHTYGKKEVQIGWIREEESRVVFTSIEKTEYYYTWQPQEQWFELAR